MALIYIKCKTFKIKYLGQGLQNDIFKKSSPSILITKELRKYCL